MLKLRGCDGTEISREPFCVAVSIHHRLAEKKKITLDDLREKISCSCKEAGVITEIG